MDVVKRLEAQINRMTTEGEAEQAAIDEIDMLRGLIAELLDTELGALACTGSHAPVEDILGRMADAVPNAPGKPTAANELNEG